MYNVLQHWKQPKATFKINYGTLAITDKCDKRRWRWVYRQRASTYNGKLICGEECSRLRSGDYMHIKLESPGGLFP